MQQKDYAVVTLSMLSIGSVGSWRGIPQKTFFLLLYEATTWTKKGAQTVFDAITANVEAAPELTTLNRLVDRLEANHRKATPAATLKEKKL